MFQKSLHGCVGCDGTRAAAMSTKQSQCWCPELKRASRQQLGTRPSKLALPTPCSRRAQLVCWARQLRSARNATSLGFKGVMADAALLACRHPKPRKKSAQCGGLPRGLPCTCTLVVGAPTRPTPSTVSQVDQCTDQISTFLRSKA